MSYGFKTKQPEKVEAPKLESSGLTGYEHEVKLKGGQSVTFIPLHAVDESFTVNVHKKAINWGEGFRFVPVGSKNTHLDFLNPGVKGSPFESSPDKEVKTWKTLRYMLVFVVEAPENLKCKGHVGFVELRDNYARKDGSYNVLHKYEETAEETVEGYKVNYARVGDGQKDTVYSTTVIKHVGLTDNQHAVIEKEVNEVQEYIVSLYDREWTLEKFRELYNQCVTVKTEETHPVLAEEEDENEIPF